MRGQILLLGLPRSGNQQASRIEPPQRLEIHQRGIASTRHDTLAAAQCRRQIGRGEVCRFEDPLRSRERRHGRRQMRQATHQKVTPRQLCKDSLQSGLETRPRGLRTRNEGENAPGSHPRSSLRWPLVKSAQGTNPAQGRKCVTSPGMPELSRQSPLFVIGNPYFVVGGQQTSHESLAQRLPAFQPSRCRQVKLMCEEDRRLAAQHASEAVVRSHCVELAAPSANQPVFRRPHRCQAREGQQKPRDQERTGRVGDGIIGQGTIRKIRELAAPEGQRAPIACERDLRTRLAPSPHQDGTARRVAQPPIEGANEDPSAWKRNRHGTNLGRSSPGPASTVRAVYFDSATESFVDRV